MKVRLKVTRPSTKELQISRRGVGGVKAEDREMLEWEYHRLMTSGDE